MANVRSYKLLPPSALMNCAARWQRNYYEHIIRSEAALYAIRRYIQDNPAHE